MRTFTTKQNQALRKESSSSLTRAKSEESSAIGAGRPAKGFAVGRVGGFTTAFAHDFSRVAVFPEQESRGQLSPPEQNRAGIDPSEPAAPASADVETSDNTTPDETIPDDETESPADACTIKSKTVAHAPAGTPDDRMTVGVCENVNFTVGAGIQSADWEADSGRAGPRKQQTTLMWKAPERPGPSKITARIPFLQQTCTRYMNVVAPNDITMKKLSEFTYPGDTPGAGMTLQPLIHPLNVSFDGIEILEEGGKEDREAKNILGYFTMFDPEELAHAPNKLWASVLENNKTLAWDSAFFKLGPQSPGLWAWGTYQWEINNLYRCAGSSGDGYFFTKTIQTVFLNKKGDVSVVKEGERVTKGLSEQKGFEAWKLSEQKLSEQNKKVRKWKLPNQKEAGK